jgi:flagellar hook protein FlgE
MTNLDATKTVPTTAWTAPANSATLPASATYNSSTTVTVYDSVGAEHQVNVYYRKTAANTWDAHYVYQNAAGYQEAGSQSLTFNNAGVLTAGASSGALAFAWSGSPVTPAAGSITFNLTGTTAYASDFSVSALTQDGYSAGDLKSVSIGTTGIITGTFTNGQTRDLGQVALAKFPAPTELVKLGNNLYSQSADSGAAIVGHPSTSGLGNLKSSSLELSNVDLAQQFTDLITAQRGFQANTKIITTTDDLLNLLISIKQ